MKTHTELATRPPRLLIVDDEPANREVLTVILAREGFTIASAASGEEALKSVAEEPPDLILLDVMMPAMDGYQVAARMKSCLATRRIPIIMITALSDQATRQRARHAGADDFFTKPLDRIALCLRVRELLKPAAPQG
jgi:PleD family two-component response regulator